MLIHLVATFMDVHKGFVGVSGERSKEAHAADLAIEAEEGVHFEKAWLDPESGMVFRPVHRAEQRGRP